MTRCQLLQLNSSITTNHLTGYLFHEECWWIYLFQLQLHLHSHTHLKKMHPNTPTSTHTTTNPNFPPCNTTPHNSTPDTLLLSSHLVSTINFSSITLQGGAKQFHNFIKWVGKTVRARRDEKNKERRGKSWRMKPELSWCLDCEGRWGFIEQKRNRNVSVSL